MTRPNITPGPWRPVEDAQGVCGLMHPKEEGIAVAWFSSAHHPVNGYVGEAVPIIGYPERQANAQAIAALPDCLAALELAVEHFNGEDPASGTMSVSEAIEARSNALSRFQEAVHSALTKAGYTF